MKEAEGEGGGGGGGGGNESGKRNCPQTEARIGNIRRPGNSMDRNLITRKNIVIRDFLPCVHGVTILIPDSSSKAL